MPDEIYATQVFIFIMRKVDTLKCGDKHTSISWLRCGRVIVEYSAKSSNKLNQNENRK